MAYKVRVTGPGGTIVFEASSPFSEGRNANYEGFNIVHLPTSIIAYRNTDGRKFGITGKLVSRTVEEATANASYVDLARTWVLPDFGASGATPPILRIYGYNHINIDGRQVVLRSYGWNFPEEVDYIWQGSQAMPIIGTLQLDFEEVYSAGQVTGLAWKLAQTSGGSFEGGGGQSATSAFWMDFGNARTTDDPQASASITAPSVPMIAGIANILNMAPINPALAGSMLISTAASVATSSPDIIEATRQPPISNNPFVSGVTTYPYSPAQSALPMTNTVTDPFARSSEGLAPPTIIGA